MKKESIMRRLLSVLIHAIAIASIKSTSFRNTRIQGSARQLAEPCTSNADCPEGYCAGGTCLDSGGCETRLDCQNPSNAFWVVECVGVLDCNQATGRCGVTCGDSFCPNGDDVECAVSPCSIASCDEAYEHCVNDYCGGCNAIFLNASGTQVCERQGSSGGDDTVGEASVCTSDTDCDVESEYCARGQCLRFGTCGGNVFDCLNPANKYEHEIDCTGYDYCSESGKCELFCTDLTCPRGDLQECDVTPPCDAIRCDEAYVSCVNDFCGGCHAIFYTASGQTVCPRPCDEDIDCMANSTEVCFDGACRALDERCQEKKCSGNLLQRVICYIQQLIVLSLFC